MSGRVIASSDTDGVSPWGVRSRTTIGSGFVAPSVGCTEYTSMLTALVGLVDQTASPSTVPAWPSMTILVDVVFAAASPDDCGDEQLTVAATTRLEAAVAACRHIGLRTGMVAF